MRRLALAAASLEVGIAMLGFLLGGGITGAAAALIGASFATAAQVAAVAILRPVMQSKQVVWQQRWVLGMALRFGSFLVLAVVMVLARGVLPPAWMAAGYLGTLLTLLFAETRFLA